MNKDGRGYLLPDGDAYTEELACAIIYYPNKPEYRQALRGSLDYLGTWTAWQRDTLKRGQDAARAWKDANQLSMECIEMENCDLVDLITTAVTNNLTTVINNQTIINNSNAGVCCYIDEQPINVPEPGSTSPNPGAERDSLCRQAQLAHDNGLSFLGDVFGLANTGITLSAGVVAVIVGLYAMTLPFALLATLITVVASIVGQSLSQAAQDDWEAIKEDVVCAIYSALSSGGAYTEVQNVIQSASIGSLSKDLFSTIYNPGQVDKIWNREIGDDSAYSEDYCDDCEPVTAAEYFGFGFKVDSYSSDHANPEWGGVGWSNRPWQSSVDLVQLDGHRAENVPGNTLFRYDIVSPLYPIPSGDVLYQDGRQTAASTIPNAGLGVWSMQQASTQHYNVTISEFRLLVREIGSIYPPAWVAAELDQTVNLPTGFSYGAGGELIIDGDFQGTVSGTVSPAGIVLKIST